MKLIMIGLLCTMGIGGRARRHRCYGRDAMMIDDGVSADAVWNESSYFVVERPRRRDARRRRRRLEVRGLLPDSRRIAHFLLPAVVARAEQHGLWAGPDLRKGSLADQLISTFFYAP